MKDAVSKFYSGVSNRSCIEPPIMYDKMVKLDTLPKQLQMNYDVILNKPFYLTTIPWSTTNNRKSYVGALRIPGDIINNALSKIPFTASVYYRAKVALVLQVSGTPMHQGCLLASCVPINNYIRNTTNWDFAINRLLAAPHVFLNANESTPIVLEIPFFVNSPLAAIDLTGTTVFGGNDSADYAQVEITVLNPLSAPANASLSLSVSAHVIFRELEFYVPHVNPTWVPYTPTPFLAEGFFNDFLTPVKQSVSSALDGAVTSANSFAFDILDSTKGIISTITSSARASFKALTGLHNPEIPFLSNRSAVQFRQNANLVDSPSYFEKMDPYGCFTKTHDDYFFDTNVDEMNIHNIISKPQYVGSFKVTSTDNTGTLLWNRPITPYQQVNNVTYLSLPGTTQQTILSSNLLQTFSRLTRYWRGTIKVHIQAVMTNFHFAKLVVARNYSPDSNMLTSYPSFGDVANLMTETLEFSAGGQVHTIELPYCSNLSLLPNSSDLAYNALQHGMYYIYLYQPLVVNGTVPLTTEFNVYISAGEDFQFFGYAVDPLLMHRYLENTPVLSDTVIEEEPIVSDIFVAESDPTAPVPVNSQEGVINETYYQEEIDPSVHMRPVVHVRDLIRRFYNTNSTRYLSTEITNARGCLAVPVSTLLGLRQDVGTNEFLLRHHSTLEIISSMFLGYKGGLKLKAVVNGTPSVQAWFVPPSCEWNPSTNFWNAKSPLPATTAPFYDTISEMYQFPNFLPPTGAMLLGSSYCVQTVTVERPNYMISDGTMVSSNSAGSAEPVTMSVAEMEFEVPYMSPFKFVGNSDTKATIPAPVHYTNAVNALGHIVFKIAEPALFVSGSSTTKTGITVQIFAACTDESRFGFQTFAPAVGSASRTDVGVNYQQIPSISNQFGYPPQATLTAVSPGVNYTPFYFTRSV